MTCKYDQITEIIILLIVCSFLNLKTAKNGNRECNFNSKLAVLFLQCLHNEESEQKGKETRHVEHDKSTVTQKSLSGQ